MENIELFPKYYYKNEEKFKRMVIYEPEKNNWRVGYISDDLDVPIVEFKWDGTEQRADSIMRKMSEDGFLKTSEL